MEAAPGTPAAEGTAAAAAVPVPEARAAASAVPRRLLDSAPTRAELLAVLRLQSFAQRRKVRRQIRGLSPCSRDREVRVRRLRVQKQADLPTLRDLVRWLHGRRDPKQARHYDKMLAQARVLVAAQAELRTAQEKLERVVALWRPERQVPVVIPDARFPEAARPSASPGTDGPSAASVASLLSPGAASPRTRLTPSPEPTGQTPDPGRGTFTLTGADPAEAGEGGALVPGDGRRASVASSVLDAAVPDPSCSPSEEGLRPLLKAWKQCTTKVQRLTQVAKRAEQCVLKAVGELPAWRAWLTRLRSCGAAADLLGRAQHVLLAELAHAAHKAQGVDKALQVPLDEFVARMEPIVQHDRGLGDRPCFRARVEALVTATAMIDVLDRAAELLQLGIPGAEARRADRQRLVGPMEPLVPDRALIRECGEELEDLEERFRLCVASQLAEVPFQVAKDFPACPKDNVQVLWRAKHLDVALAIDQMLIQSAWTTVRRGCADAQVMPWPGLPRIPPQDRTLRRPVPNNVFRAQYGSWDASKALSGPRRDFLGPCELEA